MRYELDEARNAAISANGGHTRGTTGTMGSVPGTMSRNLGDEIQRRLMDMRRRERGGKEDGEEEVEEGEEEVDEGDSYEETVITTQRTRVGSRPLLDIQLQSRKTWIRADQQRVGRSKGKSSDTHAGLNNAEETSEEMTSRIVPPNGGPVIRFEEGVKEFADASVGTDPVTILPPTTPNTSQSNAEAGPSTSTAASTATDGPPAYTPRPPLDPQRILDDAHPREPLDPISASSSFVGSSASVKDVDPAYEELVEGLGMRCAVLEEEMKRKSEERRKLGLPPAVSRRRGVRGDNGANLGGGSVTVYWNQMGKMGPNALVVGAGIAGAALVGTSFACMPLFIPHS